MRGWLFKQYTRLFPVRIISLFFMLVPVLRLIDFCKGSCQMSILVSNTNLHPGILEHLLEWFLEHQFIYVERGVEDGNIYFRITDKGRTFLSLIGKESEDNGEFIDVQP